MSRKDAFFPAAAWPSSSSDTAQLCGALSKEKPYVTRATRVSFTEANAAQVDAIVYSVNPHGFFAQAGPLRLFVSAHVCFCGRASLSGRNSADRLICS